MSLKTKVISFFSNKYLLMAVMIACAVTLTVAVGLAIGALKTVPEELLPLIQSLVAFMILAMFSLIFLVLIFVVISGKINTAIDTAESEVTKTIGDVEAAAAEKIAEVMGASDEANTDAPPSGGSDE